MSQMISLEQAQELVLSNVDVLSTETVSVLDVVGRVSARPLKSDIDNAPFDHSAMDGYALIAADLAQASETAPVTLEVIAEVAAGGVYDGPVMPGQCVRIMTGAAIPDGFDAVVKYEIVNTLGADGKAGDKAQFSAPTKALSNIRKAGEEAQAGEIIVEANEVISNAGVGFLAGCGILQVETYRQPRVAVIAIGSELVDPSLIPPKGKIRNSNNYALAACVKAAGGIPTIFPIVKDSLKDLSDAILSAVNEYDFVITSGGASDGDFDFIKPVVEGLGELLMTSVNMRPGKAQTFGLVNGVPVFGLPGNPAAAYVGFEMIIRGALRKMQGYTHFSRPVVEAKLSRDMPKKDPRRIFLRGTLFRDKNNERIVSPAKNQSSGLFGVLQRSNCVAVMPEGVGTYEAGSIVKCILLDVPEELSL